MSVLFKDENIELSTLSSEKRNGLLKSWIKVYGKGSQEAGSCLLDNFNHDRFPVLHDNDAKEQYENLGNVPGYFLILDHIGTSAYEVEKGPLPSWKLLMGINLRGKDVCVASLDLSWTLFFGNEAQTGTFVKSCN